MIRKCDEPGCSKRHYAKGLCNYHYGRMKRGTIGRIKMPCFIGFMCSPEEQEEIDKAARFIGATRSTIIRAAIKSYLEKPWPVTMRSG